VQSFEYHSRYQEKLVLPHSLIVLYAESTNKRGSDPRMKHMMHTRPSDLVRDPGFHSMAVIDYGRFRNRFMDERRPSIPPAPDTLFDDSDREGCERILRHRTAGEVRVVRLHIWDSER
jgi:hypothetical protein